MLVKPCKTCASYNVHREHGKEAAFLLAEIDTRIMKLIDHLDNKYNKKFIPPDPEKSGRIDIIPISEFFGEKNKEYIQDRIMQLIENYNNGNLYELSPHNIGGSTAYTEEKRILVLCLRSKEPGNPLHDINTMMFVVLHELAHMMNNTWGHNQKFWILFRFLLENAVEIELYKPIDYSRFPTVYCGLKLTYNPLFDESLKIN
ncbi:MAG: hypothetical protein QW303_01595 [Nitrososphaerota archaeon]